jgi:HD-GYP domain-containing protein (c-di-GMP phosphodiesterase class II)
VAEYAVGTARELGLANDAVDAIQLGSHLHDIGKIGVREEVLHKAGALTQDEYRHIMEHPVIGARILGSLFPRGSLEIAIVRSHHERADGRGLPDGLRGDAIPVEVRVVAVADAFDAMTSVRPYRPSLGVARALEELSEGRSVQFDPDAVDAFLRAFSEVVTLPIPTPEYRPFAAGRGEALRYD